MACESRARALAEQQRQEIERARVERSAARRQADEQRVRAQQQEAVARPPPPPATQPQTQPPTPAQATTVKDQCARSSNPITLALCEVRECISSKNWNDPYCKQQQEASLRARPEN